MKWIGQHIVDFIARFRSDVYLEGITTSTETDMLVVDSANKVSKRAIDAITVDVSDFMVDGADNRILTATGTDAMLAETYATFVNTGNVSTLSLLSDEDTGDLFSIATTTHGATTLTTTDDDATAAHFEIAADGNITLDAANDIALEAAGANVTIDAEIVTFESSASLAPYLQMKSTGDTGLGSYLVFEKDAGSAPTDGDDIGTIWWRGDDSLQNLTTYASIAGEISETDNTDEAGKLTLTVANNATLCNGITMEGDKATAGEVDVTIAAGAASTTTIAGNLNASGEDHTFTSATSAKPVLTLKTTNTTGSSSAELKFLKDAADSVNGEYLGNIGWYGDNNNASPETIQYAQILSRIGSVTDGSELGNLYLKVARHDGGLGAGLSIEGTTTDGQIDVAIAAGAASTTTIAGNLNVNGTDHTFTSATSAKPVLTLSNSNTDAESPELTFQKTANGTNNDGLGIINFIGDDNGGNVTTFAQIEGKIEAAADGSEEGELNLTVNARGNNRNGFRALGNGSEIVDTDIGYGSASTTTIAGKATVTSELTTGSIRHSVSGADAGMYGPGAEILYGVETTSVSAGVIYGLRSGVWVAMDADHESFTAPLCAVATVAAGSGDSSDGMIIKGCVTLASAYTAGTDTTGIMVYASLTAGEATLSKPTASGDFVRILGYSLNSGDKKMFFNPDNTYVEIA
tara:strand:+ start:1642 stop:3711 length:2070 start_codon:yes stop_codon:yes gene_type:complete